MLIHWLKGDRIIEISGMNVDFYCVFDCVAYIGAEMALETIGHWSHICKPSLHLIQMGLGCRGCVATGP